MLKNKKGFILAESLIVSTFVLTVLVFMFIQFKNLNTSYKEHFNYNTIPDLYMANNLSNYLIETGYSKVETALQSNSSNYIDLTNTTNISNYLIETGVWNNLISKSNIKKVLFTYYDLRPIKTSIIESNYDQKLKNFIYKLKTNGSEGYRLIVEYNDDTFSTIKIKGTVATPSIDKNMTVLATKSVCSTSLTNECYTQSGNLYTYKGTSGIQTSAKNWLWYGGHLWRIVQANRSDGSLVLVTSYPVSAAVWNNSNSCVSDNTCASLEASNVGTILKNKFLPSLTSTVQNNLLNMTYNRQIYSNGAVTSASTTQKVRLLTKTEYTSAGGAGGYLDIKDYNWLADINNSATVSLELCDGTVSGGNPAYPIGIRPVIKTNDISITAGSGTATDPYIAQENKSTNTSNVKVGEYISVPTTSGSVLTRVESNTDGLKVILNGLTSTSAYDSNSTLTFSKSITIYTSALTTFKNTLNTAYSDFSNHTYDISNYIINTYAKSTSQTLSSDIGLPAFEDMFSGNDLDISTSATKTFVDTSHILNPSLSASSWMMNSLTATYVLDVRDSGFIDNVTYGTPTNTSGGVRPVWYLISEKALTGGTGTANNPYTLN